MRGFLYVLNYKSVDYDDGDELFMHKSCTGNELLETLERFLLIVKHEHE